MLRKPNALGNTTIYPSVEALAAELGLSRSVTYRELRAGRIPAIRVGPRRFVIPKAAIAEWLKNAGGQLNTTTDPRGGIWPAPPTHLWPLSGMFANPRTSPLGIPRPSPHSP